MKTSIALFVSVFVLAGCASSQASQQPTVAEPATPTRGAPGHGMGHGMGHDMADNCPMAVEGTTARAEDVEGGAAMAFTTTGDVAELRRRVAQMAQMHEMHHGEGHGGRMGGGGMGGGTMMPPATARSEEIEGGARLVFTPKDPADLPKLREHARQHAEKMASGQCPMNHGHGGTGTQQAEPAQPKD